MAKKILLIFICLLLLVSALTACSKPTEPVQYDSLADLSKAVGFDVIDPSGMPEGYALAGYYSVGSKLAQIVYVNGDKELIFAMTPLKKVESEFGEFDETKDIGVNGVYFDFSYADGSVRLASARAGSYTYAIYAKAGLAEEEMKAAAVGLGLSPAA